MIGLNAIGTRPLSVVEQSGIVLPSFRYWATEDYVTRPDDTSANRHYVGVIAQPLRLTRTVIDGERVAGRADRATGSFEVVNTGALDGLIAGMGFRGRAVKVQALPAGDRVGCRSLASLGDAETVFEGVMETTRFDPLRAEISVKSRRSLIETPIQSITYKGTGGFEGGDDLKNKPKPVALGKAFGVSPPYLGVVEGLHVFQVAGHEIRDVPEAFDKGVALIKIGGTPSIAGEYAVDTANGTVKFATRPESLTCNIEGYVDGTSSFLVKSGELIQAVLLDFAQVPNSRLDVFSLLNLDSDQPAEVGFWVGTSETTTAEVVQALLAGITAWGGFNRLDRFEVGQLKLPGTAGAIRALFDETNIVSIERLPGPTAINPPTWRHVVGWKRNYLVTVDVAAGATEAQRQFMEQEFREAAASNGNIQSRFPDSKSLFTPGLFAAEADAQTEAERLLTLFGGDHLLYRIVTRHIGPEIDIGQTVQVSASRFGLDARPGTILALRLNLAARETELDIFL